MRAAIYCRVSTDSQETDGTSLTTQEASARAYCERAGYEVAAVYREARSGTLLKERLELAALRDAARQGAFQRVVVHAVDRLTRGDVNLWGFLQIDLGECGVTIESATEQLDNSSIGQVIQTLHAWKAGTERASIVERSKRGRDYRLAAGQLATGGADLYGYRRDESKHKRVIYEPEAAVVRRIYADYAAGGTVRSIAVALSAEGITRPKRATYTAWSSSTVAKILRNPAYKGETLALRTDKDKRRTDPAAWVRLPADVTPALVDAALWATVQRRLDANNGDETRNATRPLLLRGRIYCGVCGMKMSTATSGRARNMYYRCTYPHRTYERCGNTLAPAAVADAEAWQWARAQIMERGWLRERAAAILSGANDAALAARLDVARAAVAGVDNEARRLLSLYTQGIDFDQGIMAEKSAQLQARKSALLAEVAALEHSLQDRAARAARVQRLEGELAALADSLSDSPAWAEQRAVIDALNTRAVWLRGQLALEAGEG